MIGWILAAFLLGFIVGATVVGATLADQLPDNDKDSLDE